MAADEARRDLREKLQLERQLLNEIRRLNLDIVRAAIREYASSGLAYRASQKRGQLSDILTRHYMAVRIEFDNQLSRTMPENVAVTPAESAALATLLARHFTTRAEDQSAIITDTNQSDINQSIDRAVVISQDELQAGRPQTQTDIALVAGAILSRQLSARAPGIAATETQAAAETSKQTESEVLTGIRPSIVGGTAQTVEVSKEWVTVGDERVRDAHAFADAQTQALNQPFRVGTDDLQFPGDMSRGASIENVINCRCSSVVSRDDVLAVRVRRATMPQLDREASEQLLTSLGE